VRSLNRFTSENALVAVISGNWRKKMSKEQKSNKEAKKPKKDPQEKKEKKDPKRYN
jgi:hypothetical protein